jgi:hypothetical protein
MPAYTTFAFATSSRPLLPGLYLHASIQLSVRMFWDLKNTTAAVVVTIKQQQPRNHRRPKLYCSSATTCREGQTLGAYPA